MSVSPHEALEELELSVIEERRVDIHAVVAVVVSHNHLTELLESIQRRMAGVELCEPGCLCPLHSIAPVLAKATRGKTIEPAAA